MSKIKVGLVQMSCSDSKQENLWQLKQMRLLNGKQLNIVELPMPDPVIWEEQWLPGFIWEFLYL